jgi:hypothetical protein
MRELVETQHELNAARADYERMEWEIVEAGDRRIVAERGLRGSWWWHLLFFVIIPIGANLAYSAYRRYDRPERRIVRLAGTGNRSTNRGTDTGAPKKAVRRVSE